MEQDKIVCLFKPEKGGKISGKVIGFEFRYHNKCLIIETKYGSIYSSSSDTKMDNLIRDFEIKIGDYVTIGYYPDSEYGKYVLCKKVKV